MIELRVLALELVAFATKFWLFFLFFFFSFSLEARAEGLIFNVYLPHYPREGISDVLAGGSIIRVLKVLHTNLL